MEILLWIGLGGFFGAVFRYLLGNLVQNGTAGFPIGTLVVNMLGSFVLGFLMYAPRIYNFLPENAKGFFAIGLLGAFTTMSTFSYESFQLLENNQIILLGSNVLATISLTFLAIYLGKLAANLVFGQAFF